MEKFFALNDHIDTPQKIFTKRMQNCYLVLAYDKPNWMVLDEHEFALFSLIDKGLNIKDALNNYAKFSRESKETIIGRMQSLLEKIEKHEFYEATSVSENEPIHQIKRNIHILLTHKCNMRCIHCYMAAGNALSDELSTKQWKDAIERLSEAISSTEIVFSGGEPLTREDSIEIMSFAKKLGHRVVLFTNGTLVNSNNIQAILKCVDEIQMSMEGTTKDSYERVRGKHTFDKFIRSLRIIKDYEIPLTIAVTLIPVNVSDIEENLVSFLKDFDYERVRVRINGKIEKEGNAKDLPAFFFEEEKRTGRIVTKITSELVSIGYTKRMKHKRNVRFYNCGIGCSITIDSNGEIYPCSKLTVSSGNVVSRNVFDLLNYFDTLNSNTEITKMKLCMDCDLKFLCSGGCRIDNYLGNGSYLKPICDSNYKNSIYQELVDESKED